METTRQEGKVIMVTGSNSGLGYVTALELARAGAKVVMLCRNMNRGTAAQQEIIRLSGNRQVGLIINYW